MDGALPCRCPGAGTPVTKGVPLRLMGDGCPGRAKSLAAGGVGGRWAPGPEEQSRPQATRMYVCMPEYRAWRHETQAGRLTVTTPQPHAPRMNQGRLPPGAPPPPPPSLVPKYFPPSRSSWDRKIPRAAGPALPATARPPSLSLTLCLMGLDSPQRLPGPGPEPAANLGCSAKCRLTTSPPSVTLIPTQQPSTTIPMGDAQRLAPGWRQAGQWQVGGPPLPTQGWGEGAGPGRGE